MKILISFLFFTIINCGYTTEFAKNKITYKIISDKEVIDSRAGYCRVKGNVSINGTPISNGRISSYYKNIQSLTDSLGNFELTIPDTVKQIYFFKSGYSEIIIEPYVFKSRHEVIIDFYAEFKKTQEVAYKPVIYCYSNKRINPSIQLDVYGDLTFTYPFYNQGWNVQVDINGIYDKGTEKNYPYLFWEGEINDLTFQEEDGVKAGFIIEKSEIIPFLEKQLLNLGLNQQEQTDFITFWAPKMIQNNYVFVQFLVDDEYKTTIADLIINPKPDNMRRIYMLYEGFDTLPIFNTIPQKFETFQRKGFTVVEWGGSIL